MTYSLYQLHEYLRRVIALNFPSALWVRAEIAAVGEKRGHFFLQLVENGPGTEEVIAQGEAVLWQNQARKWARQNKTEPEDCLQEGREVRLRVRIDFHERFGLKLIVDDIDLAFTVGQLALRRQRTLDQLREQGLLTRNPSLPLAAVPQRLAVISSPQAAGYHDFLDQLRRNTYGYQFRTELYPAAMQGRQTAPEVSRQLRLLARRQHLFDAVVIIRGGGSRLDLADFDEPTLCTAAAQVPIPLITGIGHETDQSVLDLVAHTALKTPTAVADFLIERFLRFESEVLRLGQGIRQRARETLVIADRQLEQWRRALPERAGYLLERQEWTLEQAERQLPRAVRQRLRLAQLELDRHAQTAQLLSIEQAFERGFSLVTREGAIVNQHGRLSPDTSATLHLRDGRRDIRIEK